MAIMMFSVFSVSSAGLTFVSGSDAYQPVTLNQETPLRSDFIYVTQKSYASTPLNLDWQPCQPGVQNEYPENATAGQRFMINTTVTGDCVGSGAVITQVIVNILLPNSSVMLSTAPASPSYPSRAINWVTAPATPGPWRLIVQVFWNGYPSAGNCEEFQTAITIKTIEALTTTPEYQNFALPLFASLALAIMMLAKKARKLSRQRVV
jgi:hypothetical protein